MENIWGHGEIKLVTKYERRNYFVYESNYNDTKWFFEKVLATEMKKTKVKLQVKKNLCSTYTIR